jgi:uncharacterized damage-inducible protein DinB
MKFVTAALLFAVMASAQEMPNPLTTVSKNIFTISKNDILRSADKIPENLWSYQPTKEVRTVAQMFAHVADSQYEFCGVAAEGKSVSKDIEKTKKTRPEIMAALKEAFAYCDDTYAKMTDANAAEMATFFNMKITKLGAMDFNTAHNMEHYGNLVTYMRINGIVPPSSEPRPPAAKKK